MVRCVQATMTLHQYDQIFSLASSINLHSSWWLRSLFSFQKWELCRGSFSSALARGLGIQIQTNTKSYLDFLPALLPIFSLVHAIEPHFIPRTASEHACSRALRRSQQQHTKSEHFTRWANQGMDHYNYHGIQTRTDGANTDKNCLHGLTACCNST
jgi:hypothetical protein